MNSFKKTPYNHSIMRIIALSVLLDALIIFSSALVMFYLHPELKQESLSQYISVISLTTVFSLVVFYFFDMYSNDVERYYKSLVHKIILLSSIVFSALIMVMFALKVSDQFSRIWLGSWFLLSTLFLCFARIWISALLRRSHREGKLRRNVAIIGGGEQGLRMLMSLSKDSESPTTIPTVYDDRIKRLEGNSEYPIVGTIDDLIQRARLNQIDEILIALPWDAETRTLDIINQLQELPVHIRLCPDLVAFHFQGAGLSYYGGVPVIHVYDKPIDGWAFVFKEIEDRVLALLALILVFPIMLLVTFLIKLDSKGPIFFRQKRYGFNNQLIEVYKFRTMHVESQDSNAETLVTRNDPRITRVGKILRRSSLDELPQILNVLKGEMSMVGPRPHATKAKAAGRLYNDVVPEYAHRHKVKPGISGWAQVQGWRGETDTEEKIIKRVEHDLYYIDNWSLGFDIYILVKTVLVVFRTENAY